MKIAVLLENKIDAIAQEEQSKRYFLRAEKLKQELGLTSTVVGIIAPENYLQNNQEAKNYPFQISYESVTEWFSAQAGMRDLYRAAVLTPCIWMAQRLIKSLKLTPMICLPKKKLSSTMY